MITDYKQQLNPFPIIKSVFLKSMKILLAMTRMPLSKKGNFYYQFFGRDH